MEIILRSALYGRNAKEWVKQLILWEPLGLYLSQFIIFRATEATYGYSQNYSELTIVQVTKIYPEFRETSGLIIVFRTVRHWPLSNARHIRSSNSHFHLFKILYIYIYIYIYIYLPSYIQIFFRVVLFPSSFSFKSLYVFLFSPMPATYADYPTIPDVIILIMCDEIIFVFVSAVTKIRLELFVYVF